MNWIELGIVIGLAGYFVTLIALGGMLAYRWIGGNNKARARKAIIQEAGKAKGPGHGQ